MYGTKNCGCYADGALGHQHLRDVLANLVEEGIDTLRGVSAKMSTWRQLAVELRGPMSDDASEESLALRFVNETLVTGDNSFGLHEGDLILARNSDWDSL